jgi:hypothetical protein
MCGRSGLGSAATRTTLTPALILTPVTDTPATRHKITLLEWVGVGAGALALIASFLPWYDLSGTFADQQRALGFPTWTSAWRVGFLGWFPVMLLVIVGLLIAVQLMGKQVSILPPLWITLALLAVVMILLRWITVPDAGQATGRGPDYATLTAGFGLFMGLLAAFVSAVAGFLSFRSTHKVKTAD